MDAEGGTSPDLGGTDLGGTRFFSELAPLLVEPQTPSSLRAHRALRVILSTSKKEFIPRPISKGTRFFFYCVLNDLALTAH